MNILDLVVLVWVGFAAFTGFRRGAALQLVEYAGLLAGLLVAALVGPQIARLASSSLAQAGITLGVLIIGAGIGQAGGWAIGRRLWAAVRRTSVLGSIDSVGGSVVSVVAVLLATWFLAYNLANGPIPIVSREIQGSGVVRALDAALPRPPALLSGARQLLNRFGFPEVFADLPPAAAGPVKVPDARQAAAIARKAEASTVRIAGPACGLIEEGSGFVVAPHYVVTNAHVVAGVTAPQVQVPGKITEPATVVWFDPKLDIAVLRVTTTPGPVLQMDPNDVSRGAQGVVIGYPGGGPLVYGAAGVRRELHPIGRDIYGNGIVERAVYELQAIVRPGNSGGPFFLADGVVGGVVFAASTTDSNVGYALTSSEVLAEVHKAEGRTAAVSTQGCTR